MKNAQTWTREQFDAAFTRAGRGIAENLQQYVDDARAHRGAALEDSNELVVVMFLDDDRVLFSPRTKAEVVAAFDLPQVADRIREKVWPEVPILFIREEAGRFRFLQTASVIYRSAGARRRERRPS